MSANETYPKPNQRKVLLINPRFQLQVLAWMVGASLVICGIFYSANWYFFHKFTRIGEQLGLPSNHVFFEFIHEQQATMNWVFLVTATLASVALAGWALFVSHRVAGPLYRLHRHMLAVSENRTRSDVRFRDGDFFPEVAEAYNAQLHTLMKDPSATPGDQTGRKAA